MVLVHPPADLDPGALAARWGAHEAAVLPEAEGTAVPPRTAVVVHWPGPADTVASLRRRGEALLASTPPGGAYLAVLADGSDGRLPLVLGAVVATELAPGHVVEVVVVDGVAGLRRGTAPADAAVVADAVGPTGREAIGLLLGDDP